MRLRGKMKKTIVIFGGSSGTGLAIIKALSGEYHTVCASRTEPPAEAKAGQWLSCDVRRSEAVNSVFNAPHGEIYAVINCAATGAYAPFSPEYHAYWQEIVDTSVMGAVNVMSATCKYAPQCEHLLTIGSVASRRPSPTPGNDIYAAAKTAVSRLQEDFRLRLRQEGAAMRVTLLTPGYIEGTRFGETFYRSNPEMQEPLFAAFQSLVPDDIAQAVLWCLSRPSHVEVSELVIRPREQAC